MQYKTISLLFQTTRTVSSSSSSCRRTVRIHKRHAKTKYLFQFLPEIKPSPEDGNSRDNVANGDEGDDKGDDNKEKPEKEEKPKKKKKNAGGKNGKTGNNMERKKTERLNSNFISRKPEEEKCSREEDER